MREHEHPVRALAISTVTRVTCTHCNTDVVVLVNGGVDYDSPENVAARALNEATLRRIHEERGEHAFHPFMAVIPGSESADGTSIRYTRELCTCGERR